MNGRWETTAELAVSVRATSGALSMFRCRLTNHAYHLVNCLVG